MGAWLQMNQKETKVKFMDKDRPPKKDLINIGKTLPNSHFIPNYSGLIEKTSVPPAFPVYLRKYICYILHEDP